MVKRNTQQAGMETVCTRNSQTQQICTLFVSPHAGSSDWKSALVAHCSATTTTAAPCSPIQCLVCISPLLILSIVTPCSLTETQILQKKVHVTISQQRWSSKAWVPSDGISATLPPPSDNSFCLVLLLVHFRSIPDGFPGPLPPFQLTWVLQSQKLNVLHVQANSPAHSISTVPASMLMHNLSQEIMYR
jgi:hypothetical protein